MKRAVSAIFGTILGLVMLLSFKSESTPGLRTPTVAASGPIAGSGTPGSTSYTGDSVNTRWGAVQVRITVANGKLATVEALEYPSNNHRDQEINSYAIPELNDEATKAGSARIDTISGATVTSDGYIQSLQSALTQAGI